MTDVKCWPRENEHHTPKKENFEMLGHHTGFTVAVIGRHAGGFTALIASINYLFEAAFMSIPSTSYIFYPVA